MAAPAIEQETAYITKADFDQAIEAMHRRFDERLTAFKEELLSDLHEQIDQKIQSARNENLEHVQGLVDKAVEDEARQRRDDVHDVKQQVDQISSETKQQLSDVNERLGPLIRSCDQIAGTLDSWSKAMDASKQLYDENKEDIRTQGKQIAEVKRDVDDIQSKQQAIEERQEAMRRTIHGTPGEDGPPSVYSLLKTIDEKVGDVKRLAEGNLSKLNVIEADRAAEKEKWEKRRQMVMAFTQTLLGNKFFWFTMLVVVIGLFVVINPELQDFFLRLPGEILKVFSANQ